MPSFDVQFALFARILLSLTHLIGVFRSMNTETNSPVPVKVVAITTIVVQSNYEII